jgi:hypothetical protein
MCFYNWKECQPHTVVLEQMVKPVDHVVRTTSISIWPRCLCGTTTIIASVLANFWVSEPSSATVVHFCISWLKNYVLAHNGFWRTDLSCKMISNLSIAVPPPASTTLPSAIRAFVFAYACVVSLWKVGTSVQWIVYPRIHDAPMLASK